MILIFVRMPRGHSSHESCRQSFLSARKKKKEREKKQKQQCYTDSWMWTKAKHSLGNNQSRQVFIARNKGPQRGWPPVSELDTSVTNGGVENIAAGRWLCLILPVYYTARSAFGKTLESPRTESEFRCRRATPASSRERCNDTHRCTATFKLEVMSNFSARYFLTPWMVKQYLDGVLSLDI